MYDSGGRLAVKVVGVSAYAGIMATIQGLVSSGFRLDHAQRLAKPVTPRVTLNLYCSTDELVG